ncbi:ribosome hibernation-promoting factor, HPF/YfiA family [Galenea microaerophila]
MQINITGHHIEITDALRNHVTEKLQKLMRHFDHATRANVILTVEPHKVQRAEVELHVPGANLFAKAETHDMYEAIDTMVDKLDRQIIKYKEKLTDHHQKSGGINGIEEVEEA